MTSERKWFGLFHRHTWGKWSEPYTANWGNGFGQRQLIATQHKVCKSCGKTKARKAA